MAANSIVGDRIWQKFKLIKAFIVALVTCKNDEDPSKSECTSAHIISPIISLFRRSRAANSTLPGWILLNFERVRDFMVVLVTCKNEEDPIKMEELECSQDCHHYMGAICCHGHQSSDPIRTKTLCSLSPPQ